MGKQMFYLDLIDDFNEVDEIDLFQGKALNQIIEIISKETGLKFKPSKQSPRRYEAKYKNLTIEISLGAYIEDHAPFISFDFHYKRPDHYGGGYGCDSVETVIRCAKNKMSQAGKIEIVNYKEN